MFVHKPYTFEELEAETTDAGRVYKRGDKSYRSVTTILGELSKKGIMAWRQRIGKEAAQKITTAASRRGTKFHTVCEKYVNNQDLKKCNPLSFELFQKVKPVLDQNITTVYNTEFCLFSDRLNTAGRCDLFCEWNGVPTVVDYKSSTKPKKEEYIENYLLQGTVYSMMIYERLGIPVKNFAIVIGCEELPEAQVFTGKVGDYYKRALQIFNS